MLTTLGGRRILFLGSTTVGTVHDKHLAEEAAPSVPAGSRGGGDLGFQGLIWAGIELVLPLKKPRNGELTAEEKAVNRQFARLRVAVEHAIGGMKIYRIIHDIYRNLKVGVDDLVVEVSAGLYNLTCALRDAARTAMA